VPGDVIGGQVRNDIERLAEDAAVHDKGVEPVVT
jgi:hypothetical protein